MRAGRVSISGTSGDAGVSTFSVAVASFLARLVVLQNKEGCLVVALAVAEGNRNRESCGVQTADSERARVKLRSCLAESPSQSAAYTLSLSWSGQTGPLPVASLAAATAYSAELQVGHADFGRVESQSIRERRQPQLAQARLGLREGGR